MSVRLETKYVMVEPPHLPGLLVPVLLPACIEHISAAAQGRPVSAGFVKIDPAAEFGVSTYGSSVGLKLKPDERDAKLIARWYGALLPAPAEVSPKESP